MGIAITCELCGRQWRVKDELAGKKIRCKNCRSRISVPELPAWRAQAAGEQPADDAPPSPPTQRKPNHKTLLARRRSLRIVGIGLMFLFGSLIIHVALGISKPILPFIFHKASMVFVVTGTILPICATSLALLGEVLCLWVPRESQSRPFIVAAFALDLVSVVGGAVETAALLAAFAGLLWLAALVALIFYIRQLAIYLDKHELANDAERVIALPITIAGLYVLWFLSAFIPIVGFLFIFACVAGIFVCYILTVVKYGALLRDLRMAIAGYY